MDVLRQRVLVLALISIAAIAIGACGSEGDPATPPPELEDTIGLGGESAKEVQARVENRIGECMRAQGFQYQPVDPFAAQQARCSARATSSQTRTSGYATASQALTAPHTTAPSEATTPP